VEVQQWVESPLGRRRRFPIIPGDNAGTQKVFREAVNFIPQSMASDITTMAFVRLSKTGLNPLISVHDSILCEVSEEQAEAALAQLVLIMQDTGKELYGTKVKFTAEPSMGKKWSDL
jgi:DNA polymerase I-like protein with 3'-5' exonuclease and polymerase domains